MEDRQSNSDIRASLVVLLLLPLAAHLLFSWIGFTPTDDGFTLAYSRRLLDGEIPHRDFIILRPFFSPLMHAPEVFFGGDYTFWVSRLIVWIQLVSIAWIWMAIISRLSNFVFGSVEQLLIALIAFALTAHNFPIMAWHTIDGLFLASLGVLLCLRSRPGMKMAGYALLGLACLCKQSFVFMPPLVLLVLGDWRRTRFWGAFLLPGFAYGIFMFFTGGLTDAAWQLTSRTGLLSAGLARYLNPLVLAGVAYAFFAGWLVDSSGEHNSRLQSRTSSGIAVLLLTIPWLVVVISLFAGIIYLTAFFLFGMVMGLAIYFRWRAIQHESAYLQAASLVLIAAWSASLSEGYNTPALAAGALFVVAAAAPFFRRSWNAAISWRILTIGAGITLLAWGFGRMNYVYRDRPARYLDKQLGEVFPGGRLIKTSSSTYEFLADLRDAIATVQRNQKRYIIIPDVPGYWVKSKQANPLPIAWPHGDEISNPKNFKRLTASLEANRSSTIVIAQKVEATTISEGLRALPDSSYYAIVGYVRNRFTKVGETKFFESTSEFCRVVPRGSLFPKTGTD